MIENYNFDLRSFHQAELRPLTEAIKCPPNGKHLTDFSFLPRTCRWNHSMIENYNFDLRSFHRAELRPLTEAIKRPPNCKH